MVQGDSEIGSLAFLTLCRLLDLSDSARTPHDTTRTLDGNLAR